MKKQEFIKAVKTVMDKVEASQTRNEVYTCNEFHKISWRLEDDYKEVFGELRDSFKFYHITACFGFVNNKKVKQVRLNALAMYLAQSLEFKTYKDL